MISFTATIFQFGQKGEKTGWSYIAVSETVATQLKPNTKKSFRVKGKLDDHSFSSIALLPAGDGSFIMPLNATLRKAIRKQKGATILVQLELDTAVLVLDEDLLTAIADEPIAAAFFNGLPPSHKAYYSKWIQSAKTIETKAKRIALAVNTLAKKMNYGEMIRWEKANRSDLGM
jgi:hypothetical protein